MTTARTVHDLTALLETHMPVWPTAPLPVIEPTGILARDGYAVERISCLTHSGTHVDAPSHFLEGAETVDAISPDRLVGRAAVLDLRKDLRGEKITPEMLKAHWPSTPVDVALLESGWSHRRAPSKEYLYDFPGLTPEAARWAAGKKIFGIGIDTLGIDPYSNSKFEAHKVLLGKGIWLLEALDHLDTLREGRVYTLVVAPLKIARASGAMARVFALET